MIIVDSSFWMEFFEGSESGKILKNIPDFISEDFIVPSIIIFEVHKKLSINFNEEQANEYCLYFQNGTIIELNYELAVFASKLSRKHKLPLADSIIYATALKFNAKLYTLDSHFKGLPNVEYFDRK